MTVNQLFRCDVANVLCVHHVHPSIPHVKSLGLCIPDSMARPFTLKGTLLEMVGTFKVTPL